MIDANLPTPLYIQIRDYILTEIDAGRFPPHTKIPSERELAEQLTVSRMTVNKAIQELMQQGILYSQVGKGTFVSPKTFDQELSALTSFSEDMAHRGRSTDSRVLLAEIRPAEEHIAQYLQIPKGTAIVLLQRVRLANQQPVALESSHIIAELCPNILANHDFSQESLYQALRQDYGLAMKYAEQSFEARKATAEESTALEIPKGNPILQVERVTYDDNERPVEYVESAYRGDRYKFRAILRQI